MYNLQCFLLKCIHYDPQSYRLLPFHSHNLIWLGDINNYDVT